MDVFDRLPSLGRRRFLIAGLALPVSARGLVEQIEPSFLTEYQVAGFTETEGWLLLVDDDLAGTSDWRADVLAYDFRAGTPYLGIANRLEPLRGIPESIILLAESDGGGQQLRVRLSDSVGQYFETTIVRLDRPGVLRATRSLHDLGGPAWYVFGGPGDRVPRPPMSVNAIMMPPGPGRRSGSVRLKSVSVRTRLRWEEGLRLRATPLPSAPAFVLSVENLLPLAREVALAYNLVGLDGAAVASGAMKLHVAAGGQTNRYVPLAGPGRAQAPPVVQVAARAIGQGASETTHASLVDGPLPVRLAPLAGMGIHAGLSSRVLVREMARLAGQVTACGAGWVREDFSWPQISPLSDRVSVRRHDRAIETAAAAGLRVLGLPTTWPFWAHSYSAHGIREFTTFLSTIARRYRGRVAAWEIWNEPNQPGSWRGTPEQYADLLAAAYATLKEIDPDVLVLGPCLAGPGDLSNPASLAALNWLARLLAARPPLFDVFSFHPYEGRRSPEQAGLVPTIRRLRDLLQAAGRSSRIWITEQGWASDYRNPAIDDVQQARLLARAYLLARFAGIETFFWYDARNDGLAPDDHEDNYGLLRRDFLAKAAYRALAVLADVLGDQGFDHALPAPAGAFALRFSARDARPPVLALWSHQRPAVASVALSGQGGIIRDLDGASTVLSMGSHRVRLATGLVRLVVGEAQLSGVSP